MDARRQGDMETRGKIPLPVTLSPCLRVSVSPCLFRPRWTGGRSDDRHVRCSAILACYPDRPTASGPKAGASGAETRPDQDLPMPTADAPCPCDGATLATSVRCLAAQVHRTLNDPAAGGPATRDLARQVDHLRRCLADRASSDLARWLEGLRRRIEVRGPAPVEGPSAE
jgi:hypothetical protein